MYSCIILRVYIYFNRPPTVARVGNNIGICRTQLTIGPLVSKRRAFFDWSGQFVANLGGVLWLLFQQKPSKPYLVLTLHNAAFLGIMSIDSCSGVTKRHTMCLSDDAQHTTQRLKLFLFLVVVEFSSADASHELHQTVVSRGTGRQNGLAFITFQTDFPPTKCGLVVAK